jgi:Flp pilus assembly pilin Flp
MKHRYARVAALLLEALAAISVKGGAVPDQEGSVMVEYAVLLSVVAVGLSLAVASLGVPLVSMYLTQKTWLLLPFP